MLTDSAGGVGWLRERDDGQTNTAHDEVGGHLMGSYGDELHGVFKLGGAEDEAIVIEADEAEVESVADAHGKDGGRGRLIRDQRVVMAIDDGDGAFREDGLHAGGLLTRDADSDEARPAAAAGGAARAQLFEHAERQLHQVDGGGRRRHGVMDGGAWCHDRNGGVGEAAGRGAWCGRLVPAEQVLDSEYLRGEQAIESVKAEGAAATQEV